MKKVLTLAALGSVLLSSTAMAAGFHLREQSAAAQGNAYAGATAGAENNAYAYYNVAGLTRIKGTQFSGGATYIAPKSTAKNVRAADGSRDADVQNVVHAAISPYFTISHQINDKWFIALAGNSPFGMITKYDEDWAGADHGVTSDIKTATFTPMVAYKATDKLSLGAGLQIQYVWAHLTNGNQKVTKTDSVSLNGDALDLGYQLGLMYEFTPSTRIGVGYRSEIKHKIKGDMKSSGSALPTGRGKAMIDGLLNQDISAKLNTPAMLSLGIYHDVNERWALMAEYQRVFWSSFRELTFVSREGNNRQGSRYISQVHEHWRDTNFYAIGTSYMLDEQWKLRLGLAYDQSAVRLQHRTPRIPDSDRIWYSVGLGYQYSEKLSFDAGFTYIQAHDAKLDTRLTKNDGNDVTADYSNSIKVFSFGLTYNF